MTRSMTLLATATSLLILLGGCAAVVTTQPRAYPERAVEVPPGHMPPPGACRIWFPGRPPGQQPPPGDCFELQRQVPPGAVLVRG